MLAGSSRTNPVSFNIYPSSLELELRDYHRSLGHSSVIDEAEKCASSRLLSQIQAIDWYSMSNFWMFYLPPKKSSKKSAWCRLNPREESKTIPYVRSALQSLLNSKSDCFLKFVLEVEYRCRFRLLRCDVLGEAVARSAMAILPSREFTQFLRSLDSTTSFCQARERVDHSLIQQCSETLKGVRIHVASLVAQYKKLLKEQKQRKEREKRTDELGSEGEENESATSKDKSMEKTLITELEADELKSWDERRKSLEEKWKAFSHLLRDKVNNLESLANSFIKPPTPLTDCIRSVRFTLANSTQTGTAHSDPMRCDRPHRSSSQRFKSSDEKKEKKDQPSEAHTVESFDRSSSELLSSVNAVIKSVEQALSNMLRRELCVYSEHYGLIDSESKLKELYQMEGQQRCAAGNNFESMIVIDHLETLCDVVSETYSVTKGVSVDAAREWLRCCLCPRVPEASGSTTSSPPPSIENPHQLPKLYYSTGTTMVTNYLLDGMPTHPAKENNISCLPRPATIGEYDFIIFEEGHLGSVHPLFIFEVKNNCADIEKAGRQREKLFRFLDHAWKLSTGPTTPASPSRILELSPTLHNACDASNGNTVQISEQNFSLYFADPLTRRSHFIMITTLPERHQPGEPFQFFPSTGKLCTLLIRHYAEEVSEKLMQHIYKGLSAPETLPPFLHSIYQICFTDAVNPMNKRKHLCLPLQFYDAAYSTLPREDIPANITDDPVRTAIFLMKQHSRSTIPNLQLLHSMPLYDIRLPPCPQDSSFMDVVRDLIQHKTLRTLYFLHTK